MKTTRRPMSQRRKLRTAAQRAASRYADDDQELDEPNVRLSRAFVVVLLLHVVAVGGIFAFSALKDRQQAENREDVTKSIEKETGSSTSANTGSDSAGAGLSSAGSRTHRVKPGETLAGIALQYRLAMRDLEKANNLRPGSSVPVGRELVIPNESRLKPVPLDVQKLIDGPKVAAKSATNSQPGSDQSERTYVVQRGDSPAGIAKRFKVNYTELLRNNNIADPKKLQIGQKLLIPSNN